MKSPLTNDIRPTSDKVKEAVFSMLISYMEDEFCCLDLFAGSGNMGLEALSRGASLVFFSDSSRDSLALVRENIKICGAEDRSVILSGDFRQSIRRIKGRIDIVFIDPPYADKFILPALDCLEEAGILNDSAILVCEHSHKDILPLEYKSFHTIKDRRYGAIGISMYQYKGRIMDPEGSS